MPPIPCRLPEEVLSLISSIERRHNHLSQDEIPKLRACVGPLSLQQSLAEEVREDTLALARQLESLGLMVDDQEGEKNRRELRLVVDDFQKKLDSLRKDTRAALLASKKAIDQRSKSNRDELLAFSSVLQEKERQTSSEKTTEDALMKANSDVTTALRRTIALMQTELERSVLSSQMLTSSTATLRSTSTQYDSLSTLLSTSKHLVTALEKSDWVDRALILSGLLFFFLVVLFILKERIVDRGVRIAFWWTRFLPSFGEDAAMLKAVEEGVSSNAGVIRDKVSSVGASVISSVVPVISTILGSMPSSVPTVTPSVESAASKDLPSPAESSATINPKEEEDLISTTTLPPSTDASDPSLTIILAAESTSETEPLVHVEL